MSFLEVFFHAIDTMKANALYLLGIIGFLWLILFVNYLLKHRLNILGIYPRNVFGLLGVPFSPFIHGNAQHLFFNSIPLFILGCFVMVYGREVFWQVTLIVVFVSGFAVWLFGRKALHIGASGVIMGYFGFLLATAYYQQTALAILSAIVCLFYLGSMLAGLIPKQGRESWEAHLFGFLAGVLASVLI